MKKLFFFLATFVAVVSYALSSQNSLYTVTTDEDTPHDTIDISGNNTSSNYVTYDQYISLPAGKVLDVLMARYAYFNSTINGSGTLCLYAGGERCYLGTAKGAQYPNWTNFTGDVHIYPYKQNSSSAGYYGVIMAHGGKTFSVEDIEGSLKSGKVNIMMANNHVVLHAGATIACESGTRGFRFGQLDTEEGSVIQGYMKKGTYNSYFLVGHLNTDATLAGSIAPPDFSDQHCVGLVKEGTGTYTITGNNNFISGALRVMEGRVLVMNDRAAAETNKLRGATGAMTNPQDAVAYVFEQGVLGGTGNVAGTVDNYGIVEPGKDGHGSLMIKNFNTAREANLYVRPNSVLRFHVSSAEDFTQLTVDGSVKYYNIVQDFSVSDEMPMVEVVFDEDANLNVGDEFVLLRAKSKTTQAGDWHFKMKKPEKYTWQLEERIQEGEYVVVLKLTSFEDDQSGDDPGHHDDDNPEGTMGAFYDDGIDDAQDKTSLREYAAQNQKLIGTAISTWKTNINNENLAETQEIAAQFNMLAAENEMKFDALEPSRNQFTWSGADNLVNFAKRHQLTMRGHCLVWHSQLPEWVSSDGKKNDKNWSREEALSIMNNHITKVMKHFNGNVMEWDVVNECLDDDQKSIRANPDAYDLRSTVWQKAIGDDYIDSAFVYAHRAAPDVQLYLNDYGVELQGKAKSSAFYNLAVRLKNDGIPIHGVGIQCHFSVGDVDSVKLEKAIQRFAEVGLKCVITELDMGIPSTSAENLEEQARNYRVITDIVLNNDNCPYFIIWGLKDNDSWRNASNPLLYTASLTKKPAYYAVRSALRHRVLQNLDIHPTIVENVATDGAIYDLYGCKINGYPTQPGIYIQQGRKFVIGRK